MAINTIIQDSLYPHRVFRVDSSYESNFKMVAQGLFTTQIQCTEIFNQPSWKRYKINFYLEL